MTIWLNRLSMRTSLVATIIAIGLLGMLLALGGGTLYRDQVLRERSATLGDQLRAGLRDLRKDHESAAQLAAAWFGADGAWQKAWAQRDERELERRAELAARRLADSGHAGARVALRDLPDRRAGNTGDTAGTDACAAPAADGAQRTTAVVCLDQGRALYLVNAPLPEISRGGRLELSADFLPAVQRLELSLGAPLRLAAPDGRVLYQSPRWTTLGVDGVVSAAQPIRMLSPLRQQWVLEARRDVRELDAALERIHHLVLAVTAAILIVVSLLALIVLERTALKPLRALSERLRGIRQDRRHLGQKVAVAGNAEVVELAAGFNDMTGQLKELYESLEQMAFTDALTGLPNRVLFQDRLQQMILGARRDHKPFAVFIMDLDRFKDINDTLGHHVGDVLLKEVATRLRTKLRESDTVARMGGDEFAVLLPTAGEKHAAMAARMLLQALRLPFDIEEHRLDIGASIGIALYPDHGVEATTLVQRADVAMYAAKQGGSGHAFYEQRLDRHSSTRLALMGELRRAVELEQFELHYQPKIDLGTSRVMGIEALVRWRHPREGLVLPDMFIHLLEQSGLIKSLTPWMLNEAMTLSRRLQEQGLLLTISVNLSVRDLQDMNLADTLAEQLAAHRLDPAMIELEVTESAVMTEPERALQMLARLAEMGFRLAIDDFGTGYSSFAYLKKMPVNTLKIDKSFVIGMGRDENDAAIVRTSIELAHNLNIRIVAEGVEDETTLERLKKLGCDAAQGLHVSRPLPEGELLVWLRQSSWGLRDTPVRLSLV
jgi:diguanylate cyclase (GGDEF)-like protein